MQQILFSTWFRTSFYLTAIAVLLTFVPSSPIGVAGGLVLLTILPGAQITRWLGFYRQRWNFRAVVLSIALGMVTSPLLIYWSSLLFGFRRWLLLLVFPLYILALAAWISYTEKSTGTGLFENFRSRAKPHEGATDPSRLPSTPHPANPADRPDEAKDGSPLTRLMAALLITVTAAGVFLAYFQLETAQGFYPVQMEDWQKHYGVAYSLRQTGVPPTSMFFYGMFPDDQLVYYYFLHLNAATLDLWQSGGPYLHNAFVSIIVLASLCFSAVFLLLARTLFNSQKAAVWSLAFATVIGGLDVIPILQRTILKYRQNFPEGPLPPGLFLPREHIDNWISALSLRLNTFFAYHIWVPQHLTALTILCLGCYLYLRLRERRKLVVILPVLLFALLGHSTWIAALVTGCLFLFALLQIAGAYQRQGWAAARTLFLGYAFIALAFTAIAAPFILALIGPNAPKSGIAFEIPRLDSWSILRPFQASFGPAIWARLLDLPLHFFIEMGPLLVAGLAGLWLFSDRSQPLLLFWILLLVAGALTAIFFASGRAWAGLGLILNNDLGLRALMPGQLVLALFAGYFMARLSGLALPRWRRQALFGGLGLLIGLGLAYSGWEFTAMGLAKYWTEPQLTLDLYRTLQALPQVTQAQDKALPVVQHRQHRNASRFQLSLGGRPPGFSTGEAIVFHQDVHALALAHDLSQQAFDNSLPVRSYQMFRNLGAEYIFVGPAEREAMRHPEKYQHRQYFQPVFRQGDYEIYRVQPLPFSQDRPQASFDQGAIEFEGFFVDTAPLYPGDQTRVSSLEGRGLVTAWRLTRSVDKDYTVFIHLVDAEGQIVVQADHQLWAWDITAEGPTSTWTAGLTHLDIVPIPEAALTSGEALTIRLGLWLPDTDQHFPAQPLSMELDEAGRLVVGQLN